jgi:hypothetical protein
MAINSGTYTFSEVRDGKPTSRPAARRALADRGSPLLRGAVTAAIGVRPLDRYAQASSTSARRAWGLLAVAGSVEGLTKGRQTEGGCLGGASSPDYT